MKDDAILNKLRLERVAPFALILSKDRIEKYVEDNCPIPMSVIDRDFPTVREMLRGTWEDGFLHGFAEAKRRYAQ